MPTLEEIIESKIKRLDDVPDVFNNKVTRSQSELFDIILELFDSLETDGGALVFNSDNLSKVNLILNEYRSLFGETEYQEAVSEFAKEFGVQARKNDDLLRKTFDGYKRSDALDDLLRLRTTDAVNRLIGAALDPNFFDPIRTQMTEAISSEGSFTGLVKSIKDIVMGDRERLGRLDRYARQISSDLFSITDRSYTQSAATSLGAKWYRYTGGTITDSRAFCVQRNGKYYHENEVKSWASQSWQGKINPTDSTTIFTQLGGYNCKHSLIPVSLAAVPKTDIQRNINNGNFSPTDRERQLLGLDE